MTPEEQKKMFDYLKDNLSISVFTTEETDYYFTGVRVRVELSLRNPETDQFETISSNSDSVSLPSS